MKEFEVYLEEMLKQRNDNDSINLIEIKPGEKMLIDELVHRGLIKNVRYILSSKVGFDFTYEGMHYFDEKD